MTSTYAYWKGVYSQYICNIPASVKGVLLPVIITDLCTIQLSSIVSGDTSPSVQYKDLTTSIGCTVSYPHMCWYILSGVLAVYINVHDLSANNHVLMVV